MVGILTIFLLSILFSVNVFYFSKGGSRDSWFSSGEYWLSDKSGLLNLTLFKLFFMKPSSSVSNAYELYEASTFLESIYFYWAPGESDIIDTLTESFTKEKSSSSPI